MAEKKTEVVPIHFNVIIFVIPGTYFTFQTLVPCFSIKSSV